MCVKLGHRFSKQNMTAKPPKRGCKQAPLVNHLESKNNSIPLAGTLNFSVLIPRPSYGTHPKHHEPRTSNLTICTAAPKGGTKRRIVMR